MEDENDVFHSLPKLDIEFFARMAYYKSLIKSGKDVTGDYSLVDEIAKNEANWPYISPWEFLFYAAYVKEPSTKKKYYEKILPRVLLNKNEYDCSEYFKKYPDWKHGTVGKKPLPYELKYLHYESSMWTTDTYSLKMPYLYALLSGVEFSMKLMLEGTVVERVQCSGEFIEKDKNNQVFLRLDFPINQKALVEKGIDGICFDFKYRYFNASISFDLGGRLTEKKDENYYENLPGYITFAFSDTKAVGEPAKSDSDGRKMK